MNNDNEIFIGTSLYVSSGGLAFNYNFSEDATPNIQDASLSSGNSGSGIIYTDQNTARGGASAIVASIAEPPVCYCAGTLIDTATGEVAVEELAIGDLVVTVSGSHRPIRWIGHRRYSGRFASNNPDILPVCIKGGALANRVPVRDLWVSPKHAIFVGGALVPAEFLVNDVSVIKADRIK